MLMCMKEVTWCEPCTLIVDILTLVLVWFGYEFTRTQWLHSKKEKRAEFLNNLHRRFEDEDVSVFFYTKIDGEKSSDGYGEQNKASENRKDEIAADKLLRLLSYICYLKDEGLLDVDEFENFRYIIDKTLKADGIIAYLRSFYGSHSLSQGNLPFDALMKYGADEGYKEIPGIWNAFVSNDKEENHPAKEKTAYATFDEYLRQVFTNPGTFSSMKARKDKIEKSYRQTIENLVVNDATTQHTLDTLAEVLNVAQISIPNYRTVIRYCYRYKHGRNFGGGK